MLFHSGARPLTGREIAGCVGYLFSMTGFGLAWLAGTVKTKVGAGRRSVHTEEPPDLADFRRLAGAAGPRMHVDEPFGPRMPTAVDCKGCRRPLGLLTCAPHAVNLCWACVLAHDETGVCYYFPVPGLTRQSVAERAAGRSVIG